MKIAVIEDEIRIREGLSRLIGRLGPQYEIAGEAENGKEGLALVRETKPDLIITDIKMSEMDVLEMLEAMLGLREKISCTLLYRYLGEGYEVKQKEAARGLGVLLGQRPGMGYRILPSSREKSLLAVIYRDIEGGNLERWLQVRMLQERGQNAQEAVGFMQGIPLEKLKESAETLSQAMEWSISLGDEVMISYPKVTKLQTAPCIYPLELENQMKLAVCAGQKEKVDKSLADFLGYFYRGSLYHPREIKECFVRFCWALVNTGKEVGVLEGKELGQQRLLEQIMQARTLGELRETVSLLAKKLSLGEELAGHLTIKRAQSLIHEFYQTGITLEEIAGKLNLTPEYLGTKFHQELGVTFGAYMKNYRMNKAKELLIGTSLKLYQIAEKTGYSDPKYFSRVFKETTGQLPADYRKTHR